MAALLASPTLARAQVPASPPASRPVSPPPAAKPNWQNLDLQTDSVFGISTERAYMELLSGKQATTSVLVGVVDDGIDLTHEDLREIIWVNPREKASNGKDDEGDGYADDMHGWNFLGSAKGNIEFETLELTRLIRKMKPKYGTLSDTTALSAPERDSVRMYRQMISEFTEAVRNTEGTVADLEKAAKPFVDLVTRIGKPNPTLQDLQQFQPQTPEETRVVQTLTGVLQQGQDYATFKRTQIDAKLKYFKDQLDYYYNLAYNPRGIVGDDTTNAYEHTYGNADITGPAPDHGTHVSGIIGAVRTNSLGIKGVADAVMIIGVRAVPIGDERDKDVANAIRYAVDNGARVINMSFGKGYSPEKTVVDEAVKYAVSKDVLLVHAAGNDGKDLDRTPNFPTRRYLDGSGEAATWIEVGASGWTDNESLVASFSNYGQTSVDVFAPGVRIYSTVPGSQYTDYNGTSMAAPVVTGLAALIRSRYPQLTALQVKDIIMKSVVKVNHEVMVGGSMVPFSTVCVSGGVVNAYNALKMAADYK